MLGKLLKHEFKASGRIIPVIYLGLLAIFSMGFAAKQLNIPFLKTTASIFLLLGGIAAIIVTYVVIVMRYYKSLFGNEGYLTLTLPVKKSSILISKVIVAFIWLALSTIFMLLSFVGFFYILDIRDIWELLLEILTPELKNLIVFMIVSFAIQMVLFIAEVYFAITVANTRYFIKSNILFAVIAYFVTSFVISALEVVGMLFLPFSINMVTGAFEIRPMLFSLTQEMGNFGIGSAIVDALSCFALFIVTGFLLKKKVSVK